MVAMTVTVTAKGRDVVFDGNSVNYKTAPGIESDLSVE